MCALNVLSGELPRFADFHPLPHQLVGIRELLHGEGVSLRQGQKIVGMVEAAHG